MLTIPCIIFYSEILLICLHYAPQLCIIGYHDSNVHTLLEFLIILLVILFYLLFQKLYHEVMPGIGNLNMYINSATILNCY